MRLALAILPAQRFALLLTFHHILLDGRFYPGLLRELMALCQGATLLPAVQGMKAYALWHREQQWDAAMAAWRTYLKPVTKLAFSSAVAGEGVQMHPFRFVYPAEDAACITLQCRAAQVRAALTCMARYAHTPFIRIAEASPRSDGQALFDSIVVFDHSDIGARMTALGGVWQDASVRNLGVTRYPVTVIGLGGERLALGLDIDLARIAPARAWRLQRGILWRWY